MFCSIEDAWGEKNFTDKPIFQQSNKPELFKNLEHFNQDNTQYLSKEEIDNQDSRKSSAQENMYTQYLELKEMFENQDKEVCIAADNHIQKCNRCRLKYLKYNTPPDYIHNSFDLNQINLMISTNKDIITIFLFGLLILLLLQLFTK